MGPTPGSRIATSRRGAPLEADELTLGFEALDETGTVIGELRVLRAEESIAVRARFEALCAAASELHHEHVLAILDRGASPEGEAQCLLELDGGAPFLAVAALASREHAVPPTVAAWVVRDACAAAMASLRHPLLAEVAAALDVSCLRLDRAGRARIDPVRAIVGALASEPASDEASILRALGAMLYRLSTGASPRGARPVAPGELVAGYPDELDDVVISALRAGRDGGLATLAAFDEALAGWLEAKGSERADVASFITSVLERVPADPRPVRPPSLRDGIGLGRLLDRRYRLDRVLGSGGMGVVFAATHVSMQRAVAVKVLMPRVAGRSETVLRFLREARIAGALSHPGLVTVFDVGEDQGAHYLVMELLEGETLRALMERRGALPLAEVLALARPLASALAHAHAHAVIHRDLKPENVFVRELDGALVPKLLDFGISKPVGAEPVTLTGAIVGTPLYLAPEQVNGDPVDARTDVYQFGALLFEMLVGQPPYAATAMAPLLLAISQGERQRLGERVPGLPAAVASVIERALSLRPADRPESIERLLGELEAAARPAPAPSPAIPRGRPVMLAVAALALGVGAFLLGSHLAAPPPVAPSVACPEPMPPRLRIAGELAPVSAVPRHAEVVATDGARCIATVQGDGEGAIDVALELVHAPDPPPVAPPPVEPASVDLAEAPSASRTPHHVGERPMGLRGPAEHAEAAAPEPTTAGAMHVEEF